MQRHHIFTCGKFKNIWLCYEGFFSKWHLYETHSPAVTFSPWTMCKWSREKQKKESSSSAFLCWVEREGEGGTNEEKAAAWDKEGGEGEKDEYELLFFRRRGIRRWFFLSFVFGNISWERWKKAAWKCFRKRQMHQVFWTSFKKTLRNYRQKIVLLLQRYSRRAFLFLSEILSPEICRILLSSTFPPWRP